MQVNMLEAKNQLSRLVKAAQAGEEVIIANHGVPVARLVAIHASRERTAGWGSLEIPPEVIDSAFTPEVDAEIAAGFLDDQ
jgi:prevent-host-death family protein